MSQMKSERDYNFLGELAMPTISSNGKKYQLSGTLNPFQLEMQIHLVDWKRENYPTIKPGMYRDHPNDAIILDDIASELPMIYTPIREELRQHIEKTHFRLHKHFNHVASSQAANINLFLPVVTHPKADTILRSLKPDLARIDRTRLDHGYRMEYWDGIDEFDGEKKSEGCLADHSNVSGTDADIAIAYINHGGEPCLWLIEHKLTEAEFTACGGFKSPGRKARHDCTKSFSQIIENTSLCYYHDVRKFNYWEITEENQSFFVNHNQFDQCPFQGGLNQLWRNQVLGFGIENETGLPYKHVTFSVVKHPRNNYLDKSLKDYRKLIANNPKFTSFTSLDVVDATVKIGNPELDNWIAWYKDVYAI